MSPHRPDLMVFVSPDKKMELHSKIYEKSILVKKNLLTDEKIKWTENMNVEYVFSDPTSTRLFSVGGLGDSGSDLGVVEFYNYEGIKTTVQIKNILPDLEKLSRAHADFSNFPWISGLDITDSELLIWICDEVLVKITFKDLKSEVVNFKTEPTWIKESKIQKVSSRAKKFQWQLKK